MKAIRIMLFAWGLFGSASVANALDMTPYIGVSTGFYALDFSRALGAAPTPGVSGTTWGAELKGGLQFGSYVGLELRVGRTGRVSRSYAANTIGNASPATLHATSDTYVSYLIKPQYRWRERIRLYALLGGTAARFKTDSSIATLQNSAWKTGFTYGAGVEYMFRKNGSIVFEVVQYWSAVQLQMAPGGGDSKASIRGVNLSVNKYF